MSLFHRHKFGVVQEDGYQYCTTCGAAVAAPPRQPAQCAHKWQEITRSQVLGNWLKPPNDAIDTIYTLRCTLCGDMKNHRIKDE